MRAGVQQRDQRVLACPGWHPKAICLHALHGKLWPELLIPPLSPSSPPSTLLSIPASICQMSGAEAAPTAQDSCLGFKVPHTYPSLFSLQALCLCCSDPFLRSHTTKRNHPLVSGSPGFKSQVCIYLGTMLGFPKATFPYLERSLSPDSRGKPIKSLPGNRL